MTERAAIAWAVVLFLAVTLLITILEPGRWIIVR